ncbi:MAG: UPF0182 family protein [candidate division NC10 bacterium]|nr:UPF0182 family protein [candidate division NC10 bacterium]
MWSIRRLAGFGVLAVLIAVLASAGGLIRLYTDWLWFQEVGFPAVFATTLKTQVVTGVALGLAFFLVLYTNALLARRLGPRDVLITVDDQLGLPSLEVLEPYLRVFILPVSLAFAAIAGWGAAGKWDLFLRFTNPVPFETSDPLFGQDIAYYIFRLPALKYLYGEAIVALLLAGLLAGGIYVCNRALRITPRGLWLSPGARRHLLALAALFLLLKAYGYRLDMYDLLYSERAVAFGAGYADVNAQLPVLKALMLLAVLTALLAVATGFSRSWRPFLGGVGALVALAILGGAVYPGLIQKFQVVPNEIVKEQPYIDLNIKFTRMAYGLDNIEEREFPAEGQLTPADLRANDATIKNIRLWDTQPLLATYSQLQEIRTYYKFTDIDIDRYRLNGAYRQVTLSPRELSYKDLPSKIWINERLSYTHGYGAVVGPVNRVTKEGLPEFLVKDIPPAGDGELKIARPELYFGELTNDYVFLKTQSKEFHYPAGDQNVYTTYEGTGGVSIGSFGRKLLFGLRFGDIKILLSDDLGPESRILYNRNIRERVERAAPFFRYDDDPYLVVSRDGRLFWFLDGYTTSDMFPYSARTRGLGNYIRNSVKATVDAYNGTIRFYIADGADPVVRAYAQIFPGLFAGALATMPEDLRAHVRYPEGLFAAQARMFALYHMRDAQVFYNKEDLWSIPGKGADGQSPMLPYYLIMRLPAEPREEFVLLLPFTPSRKDNMIAWLAARSDPPNYGKLISYNFPKQKLIYGPRQIEARIDQDSFISQQLSLWNQRGSQVIRANLLAVPIERSLLYVQPLYLAAEKGQLPQLKRVIVAFGDRIAMEETLEGALAGVFGERAGVPATAATPASPALAPGAPGGTTLAETASEAFSRALARQRAGDWAGYGAEMKRLEETLQKLRAQPGR